MRIPPIALEACLYSRLNIPPRDEFPSTQRMRARLILALGLVCFFIAWLPMAWGQNIEETLIERGMDIKKVNGQLEISFSFPEVFSTKLKERLSNGMTNRILIGVQLVSNDNAKPVAQGIAEYIIRYDIWEEYYLIGEIWPKTILQPYSFQDLMTYYKERERKTDYRKTHKISKLVELITVCGSLRNHPLSWQSTVTPDTKIVAYVQIEINPVSEEQINDADKFVRRRATLFPNIFINWDRFKADDVFFYRSPTFTMQ